MNKEQFNSLLKNYSNLESRNEDLEILTKKFPYSQPVRMLNVKSSSNLSKKVYQQRLALAAFYSTDRNVLRSLIEKGKVPSDFFERVVKPHKRQIEVLKDADEGKKVERGKTAETGKKAGQVVNKSPTAKVKAPLSKPTMSGSEPIDSQQLRDEVMANLQLLQETKSSFLKIEKVDSTLKKRIEKPSQKKTTAVKKGPIKKDKKPTAIVGAAKSAKAKKSPLNKKNELIDKFIADEPTITRGKAVRENPSDLSKASTELKEDLISENLAIIYAKQGKVNKAIEIYKKLIWKFPQKKTSFAARIEELKKK